MAMAELRTQEHALEELLKLLPEVRATLPSELQPLMTEKLIREVFETCWKHQYESGNQVLSRDLKDIVREAIAGV
jgi:hypothetical protein